MKRKWKIINSISLSIVAGASIALSIIGSNQNKVEEVQAAVDITDYSACETAHKNGDKSSLLTALRTITAPGSAGSYNALWTTYTKAYVRSDGKLFDYYSNTTNYVPGGNAQGANYSKEGDAYNREHSIPKSWWGSATSNQGADPYIVVPSDGWVNNKRSNFPFGMVNSASYTSNNSFCKLGSAVTSWGYTGTVFEPDDSLKGDFARINFYAIAKYSGSYGWTSGEGSSCFSGSASTNFGLTSYAVKLFSYWSNLDPVSEWEESVNEKVSAIQGNRNPFIDHPEYANTLWGDVSGYTQYSSAGAAKVTLNKSSETISVGSSTTLSATSSDGSNISWTTSNSSVASLSSSSSSSGSNITITANGAGTAKITAKATIDNNQVSATCTITVTKVVDSLSVSGTLSKTSYTAGDHFDPTGLTVTAHYNDSTTGNVTSSVTWSPDPLTAGTTTVTASYGGKTVDFEGITVEAKQTSHFTFVNTDFGSYDKTAATFTKDDMSFTRYYVMNQSSTIQFKSGQGYIYNNDSLNLSSITINGLSGSLTVYGGTSKNPSSTAITGSNGQYDLTGYTYFKIVNSSGSVANATSITVELSNASTKSLSSIAVSNATTSYTVGGTFVKPTVTATYSDSTTANVTSSATFSGYNMSTTGSQTVTVSYTEGGVTKTTTYSITVNPATTLSTIYITGTLGKSTYYEGDSFDPTGLTVTAQYSDNSTANVTSSVTWTPNPLTAGTTTVTASYGGKTTTLNGITVNPLVLSSISLSGQTTEYSLNDSFSFTGTCTAHYNSGSTKSVTPTSVSSPDMSAAGNKTVTVSYTEGGVTKTANYTITVTETPFVNSIEQCYSKSSGASVSNVYGLYVGSFNNGESSVIMNGEFGILLYKKAPNSSWVENQTYLCVTSASISIYKNLYELASCSVSTVSNSSVISQNIRPISTYTVTGNESSSDLNVASRLCLMSGVVTSITSNSTSGFTANKDNTVMMNVGGKSVQLFVKSGTATSEVGSVLTESLNSSSQITVKGYTGFYTSFQVQFKSLLKASSTYSAEDFASDVLSLTNSICASSSNKESDLSGVWLTLELDKWSILASDQKTILINASASQSGTTIQKGMARYDRICTKYASCSNFIGRSGANAANINKGIIANNNTMLVVLLVSTITITSVGTFLFLKKKKKHNLVK